MTGLRAGDHADVNVRGETYFVLIVVDGATTFVLAFAPRTKESHETVQCSTEWMDTRHRTPKLLCADMAFQSTELQDFCKRFDIQPYCVRVSFTAASAESCGR